MIERKGCILLTLDGLHPLTVTCKSLRTLMSILKQPRTMLLPSTFASHHLSLPDTNNHVVLVCMYSHMDLSKNPSRDAKARAPASKQEQEYMSGRVTEKMPLSVAVCLRLT